MNEIAVREERATQVSPQQQIRVDFDRMGEQFAAALPENIKPERFKRIVLTAVLSNPALVNADRKSLMESAMRAAQDGLLPDGREGAFVTFKNQVQWMPMIGGIIKKMHQSGDVALITAKVVYGGDNYRTWVDDDGEHVIYEPAECPDYDTIRQVFAMAKTRCGTVYVEALTPRDVEKIRSVSRSKSGGPWAQWWEEMAKKSAIRRLSKRLPLSSEIYTLLQRDNGLYDLSQAPDPKPSLASRFQNRAADTDRSEGFDHERITADLAHDGETGEIVEDDGEPEAEADDATYEDVGDDASERVEPPSLEAFAEELSTCATDAAMKEIAAKHKAALDGLTDEEYAPYKRIYQANRRLFAKGDDQLTPPQVDAEVQAAIAEAGQSGDQEGGA